MESQPIFQAEILAKKILLNWVPEEDPDTLHVALGGCRIQRGIFSVGRRLLIRIDPIIFYQQLDHLRVSLSDNGFCCLVNL